MQSLKFNKGLLHSEIKIPTSKSYANRALMMGALLERPLTLVNLPEATDVTILLKCFEQIGLIISNDGSLTTIENSFPQCESNDEILELDVGEGGTTARFLATLLLLGSRTYKLKLGKRLAERPWSEFLQLAENLGGHAVLDETILTVRGPISLPGEIKVNCAETTQFASAFRMISQPQGTKVIPQNMDSSVSYWRLTEKLIEDVLKVKTYFIPSDWSSASYPMAYAALNQKIFFPTLVPDPFQADAKFFELLKSLGVCEMNDNGIEVYPGVENQDLHLDVSDSLDLVPTLAFFLAHVQGKHVLKGLENLIHKESDRLGEVIKLLEVYKRKVSTTGKELLIEGNLSRCSEAQHLVMPNDHRMVMAGTLFLLHHGGGEISPAEAVNKSYPDFFEIIRKGDGPT